MVSPVVNQQNPLIKFMRQPKIYITLPSQGKYWTQGSIDIPENGQLPVYSMTAKDELLFKTPDALLNGQAVVDVIQSCLPNIKNAWACPSIDLELILVAIRLATYGDKMSLNFQIPIIDEEAEYELNLHNYIDQLSQSQWIEQVPISDEIIVYVKPLSYKHITTIGQKSFEAGKAIQMTENGSLTESQKYDLVNATFKALSDLTTEAISNSVFMIKTLDNEVTEVRFIREYLDNVDKSVIDIIQKHINGLKEQNQIKPVTVNTTQEQQERGAPETIQIPINFDQAAFFG